MIPNKDQLIGQISEKCNVPPRIRLKDYAQPLTDKLVGKTIKFIYEDDTGQLEEILVAKFHDEISLEWWGEAGPLAGHRQSEAYMLFEVADNIYFLTWYEQAAPAVAGEKWDQAGYLMAIVMDMNTMTATDSYTNPMPEGKDGTQFIMAQAKMVEVTE